MNVLFTGTYCSGKTTLSNQLNSKLINSTIIEDVTREVLSLYGKVDWTIPELRDYILIKHLIEEKRASLANPEHIIIDAGIVSFIAHDRILLKSPPDRRKVLNYFNHIKYDAVFYCDHQEIAIADDGERYTDETLRNRLATIVEETLLYLGISDYIVLKGTQAERLEHVMRTLNKIG
ncbi:MAG: ATP-binding protein [Pyrinomonadaceae bacterium]